MSDEELRAHDEEVRDRDTMLGKNASNAAERRATLIWCLTNVWATEDVERIERWDDARWHGWMLWRRA